MRVVRWIYWVLVVLTVLNYLSPITPPTTLWPIAFFGLGFPLLLVGHLISIVYFLSRRSPLGLLSVLLLGIGWRHVERLVGWRGEEATTDVLTVASYNLLGGNGFHPTDRRRMNRHVGELAACIDADVVAFEEYPAYEPLERRIDSVMRAAGLQYAFHPRETRVRIFSRYPLTRKRTLAAYNVTNGTLAADLELPSGKTITVIAAHLQSNALGSGTERVDEDVRGTPRRAYWTARVIGRNYRWAARQRAEASADLVLEIGNNEHPIIFLGDLNDPPQSYTLGQLRRSGLRDAFELAGRGLGVTYRGSIPGLRIDYVLASPDLTPVDARTLDCTLSDHYPVRASFRLD